MAKILNTTLLVTMSQAIPEGLGYGNIYASSSKIYFTSSLGVFDLTDSSGYAIVREYVTNTTWSPPANVKYVRILGVAGGGGGGGGAKRTAALGLNIGGGGGATGGLMSTYMYPGSAFTRPIYQITVGGGGNSGSGQTSAAGGAGNSGATGGSTSIISGSIIMFRVVGGGFGGGGSLTNPGQGGVSSFTSCVPVRLPYTRLPLDGGNGFGVNATSIQSANSIPGNFHALNGLHGMGSGGGGGGFNPLVTGVGTGSGVFVNNVVVSLSPGGAPGTGNSGTNGISDLLDIINLFYFSGSNTISSSYGVGSAGGGGASGNLSGTIGGGKGGDGGDYGAGAGGGGACNTGSATAGNGGAGGDGYLAIIEYY